MTRKRGLGSQEWSGVVERTVGGWLEPWRKGCHNISLLTKKDISLKSLSLSLSYEEYDDSGVSQSRSTVHLAARRRLSRAEGLMSNVDDDCLNKGLA